MRIYPLTVYITICFDSFTEDLPSPDGCFQSTAMLNYQSICLANHKTVYERLQANILHYNVANPMPKNIFQYLNIP